MKITSNTHLLASLTGLSDPAQKGQQQALQDEKQLADQRAKDSRLQAREVDRRSSIDANRDALKKIQDKLRTDRTEQTKAGLGEEDQARIDSRVNLNLRENLGPGRKNTDPAYTKPGQIIDIRV